MHLTAHLLTAVPFLVAGNYSAALGCVLPDVSWIVMEIRFRLSREKSWFSWISAQSERHLVPYRIAHSFIFIALAALLNFLLTGECWLFVGWFIHVALDLPTHWGVMQPLPLFPLRWKWPYVFKYIKRRTE